jgi:hypothetical protein
MAIGAKQSFSWNSEALEMNLMRNAIPWFRKKYAILYGRSL